MALSVIDIVNDWLHQSQRSDGDATMFELVHDEPGIAWSAILQILECPLTDHQISLLAAGPLEDLLVLHGAKFIDRIECEALQSPRFNELLGGVWQNRISHDIWDRVQKVRNEV
jgi:hypothetical protein